MAKNLDNKLRGGRIRDFLTESGVFNSFENDAKVYNFPLSRVGERKNVFQI